MEPPQKLLCANSNSSLICKEKEPRGSNTTAACARWERGTHRAARAAFLLSRLTGTLKRSALFCILCRWERKNPEKESEDSKPMERKREEAQTECRMGERLHAHVPETRRGLGMAEAPKNIQMPSKAERKYLTFSCYTRAQKCVWCFRG